MQNYWVTKSQQIYPTDLNDTQWLKIRPYLPAQAQTGRPYEHSWRIILNSIFYILQGGCAWGMLLKEMPPWKIVYHYFRLWRKDNTWECINHLLREKVRLKFGKKRQPRAGILDSQSAMISEGDSERGFDTGKKVASRKRHALVDNAMLESRMRRGVAHPVWRGLGGNVYSQECNTPPLHSMQRICCKQGRILEQFGGCL